MLKSVKSFLSEGKVRTKTLLASIGTTIVTGASTIQSLATPVDPKTLVGNVLSVIVDIFFYIGILLLCWAVGMLLLAFKNEDADTKSRAMMLLVVSAALIGIRSFLNIVLAGTGFTV